MQRLFEKLAFSVANTAAILTALFIGFYFDLERPYWAMFSVFIIAQPLAGAVRSKAVYRFFGTFTGAAVALFLVPPLVQSPVLLCTALSVWVGCCLFVSLQDRTPRNYAFLLAGYTATIVAFSVVNDPDTIFDTTVARVEEISVGILCGTIAHTLFFPKNTLKELNERVAVMIRSCAEWMEETVGGSRRAGNTQAYRHLAPTVDTLRTAHTYIAFELSNVPRASGLIRLIEDRIALFLPRLTSIQATIAALGGHGGPSAPTARLLDRGAEWISLFIRDRDAAPDFPEAVISAASGDIAAGPSLWRDVLEQSVIADLRQLVAILIDIRALARAIPNPARLMPARFAAELATQKNRPLHRDLPLALLSACAAAGATALASAIWIEGSWPEGATAAQFAAIGCSLFATLDNPAKILSGAILGILISLPFGAIYEFAIIPQIDGFVSLSLVLAPMLLLLSFLQTIEKVEGLALVLAVGFSGSLALQSTYRADFATFVNSNSAEVAGLLIAVMVNLVFRTVDPIWNAIRISRAGWRSVKRLARDGKTINVEDWTMQMFDRLELVASRLIDVDRQSVRMQNIDGLRDIRIGLNVAELSRVESDFKPSTQNALRGVRRLVENIYGARLSGRLTPDEKNATHIVESGARALATEPLSSSRYNGLIALGALQLDIAPVNNPTLSAQSS